MVIAGADAFIDLNFKHFTNKIKVYKLASVPSYYHSYNNLPLSHPIKSPP